MRSVMPDAKFEKASLMLFHVPIMESLKPSEVFHRCTKAATSVPMMATTATTGAEMPPMAAPILLMRPDMPPILTMKPVTAFPTLEKVVISDPIDEVSLPITISAGPKAAIKSPILMMVLRVPSSMPFNLSTKF